MGWWCYIKHRLIVLHQQITETSNFSISLKNLKIVNFHCKLENKKILLIKISCLKHLINVGYRLKFL